MEEVKVFLPVSGKKVPITKVEWKFCKSVLNFLTLNVKQKWSKGPSVTWVEEYKVYKFLFPNSVLLPELEILTNLVNTQKSQGNAFLAALLPTVVDNITRLLGCNIITTTWQLEDEKGNLTTILMKDIHNEIIVN